MHHCVPRCVSTAFGMYFRGRPDVHYSHERLARLPYFDEIQGHVPEPGVATYIEMRRRILRELLHPELLIPSENDQPADQAPLIFRKEMSYYMLAENGDPLFPLRAIEEYQHTFMTRDPARALASWYKKEQNFSWYETGYESQAQMYRWAKENDGVDPIVIDAADFTADPDGTMSQYCAHLDLVHNPAWLKWDPPVDAKELEIWAHGKWHTEVLNSRGVQKRIHEKNIDISGLPQKIQSMIDRAREPYLEVLSSSNRIRPKAVTADAVQDKVLA